MPSAPRMGSAKRRRRRRCGGGGGVRTARGTWSAEELVELVLVGELRELGVHRLQLHRHIRTGLRAHAWGPTHTRPDRHPGSRQHSHTHIHPQTQTRTARAARRASDGEGSPLQISPAQSPARNSGERACQTAHKRRGRRTHRTRRRRCASSVGSGRPPRRWRGRGTFSLRAHTYTHNALSHMHSHTARVHTACRALRSTNNGRPHRERT